MKSLLMCLVLCLAVLTMPAYSSAAKGGCRTAVSGVLLHHGGTGVLVRLGNLSGKIGPYLTDNLQVGIGPTLTITTTSTATFNPIDHAD